MIGRDSLGFSPAVEAFLFGACLAIPSPKMGAKIGASEGFPSAVFLATILCRKRGHYIPLRMGVWEGVKNDLPWVGFGAP